MPRFYNASLPHVWLQLLRAPNLLTVPGDPLAGFLLVAGSISAGAWLAAGASLCFYCGGLLINDLADFETDRKERPGRPLPSGPVKKQTVRVVAVMLFLVGELLCSLLGDIPAGVGLTLIAAILAYNLKLKKIFVLGPLNMGLCRGLSMMLGVSAAISSTSIPQNPSVMAPSSLLNFPMMAVPPLILTFYIAAVTHLARRETETKKFGMERWMKLGNLKNDAPATIGLLISNLLFLQALFAWPAVGLIIGNPLFLQTAFAESGGSFNPWVSLCLLALWPANRILARRFYAS